MSKQRVSQHSTLYENNVQDAKDDGLDEAILSREKAKWLEAWQVLEKAYEEKETVIGLIDCKVKGGFTVIVSGIKAMLPGSLVDVRPVRDTAHLEGKDLEFKIIKLDQKRNNVVVSRRAVIESESSVERGALLESLQEGQEVKGIVKNLTDYGAFVDLGGIDGLLHINDMAWNRVKHPSEIVNVGDEIPVKVLKFDRERTRVSLGMKQLGEDPWAAIAKSYPEGSKFSGRVTNLTDNGCLVEIQEGVEGLVHISDMDWTNKNIHPSKVVDLGDEVEVMILEIDEERRRISLGLKQCIPNPWDEFSRSFNKGDKVTGKVKSITDFGIFIDLGGGIDGLVHLSDISWSGGEEVIHEFEKGDEITAIVLQVDPERERISLGIKQAIEKTGDTTEPNYGSLKVKPTKRNYQLTYPEYLSPFADKYESVIELSADKISNIQDVLESTKIQVDARYLSSSLTMAVQVKMSLKKEISWELFDGLLEDFKSIPISLPWQGGGDQVGVEDIGIICVYSNSGSVRSFGSSINKNKTSLTVNADYLDIIDPYGSENVFNDGTNAICSFATDFVIFGVRI